ncbi:MAG: glycosyltransferase [Thermodesulfobacteriota bacterium]
MDKYPQFKPVVAHYSSVYLSLTKTWIYSQIVFLKLFSPVIITKRIENYNIFPVERIYPLYDGKGFAARCYLEFTRMISGYYPFFLKQLKNDNAVLLHSHFGYDGYEMLPLKRKLGIPMITTFYGVDVSMYPKQKPIWRGRYKKLFNEGEIFLVEGKHMKESLVELGCPREKILVQHLGIDTDKFKFIPRVLAKDGKVKILVAGSFREKKGIPYAMEAFARVKEVYDNIEMTLIGDSGGSPAEANEKKKIVDVINKHNLHESVRMLGYQPHYVFLDEIEKHHIFLSPSVHASDGDTEGGAPVSIIEASASGMPILSTLHCDIPDVVIDGKSGFLVPERDIPSLTERLEYLIKNHEMWGKLGENGHKHINENYNIYTQAERLENIYQDVIG